MGWLYAPNGDDVSAAWNDRYRGAGVFLCCGGPSLAEQPLSLLLSHGVITAAVNNSPATLWQQGVRPDLWFCVDRPSHFHPDIWRDPACGKFCWRSFLREPKFVQKNRIRIWNGIVWQPSTRVTELPNVWCFERHEEFEPATWLNRHWPTWGTRNTTDPGRTSCRSVMLVALWCLWRMGFSRVYLLGCDFAMLKERPYAFEEIKSASDCECSNRNFQRLAQEWLPAVAPLLKESGCEVFDCGESEVLTCFERITLAGAVEREATAMPFEQTAGLYAPH